jgi:hypothetical protein
MAGNMEKTKGCEHSSIRRLVVPQVGLIAAKPGTKRRGAEGELQCHHSCELKRHYFLSTATLLEENANLFQKRQSGRHECLSLIFAKNVN